MNIRTFVATAALCLVALGVSAEQVVINVDGKLTDQQKAELQLQAAKSASSSTGLPSEKVEVVKEWVDIGTAIGSGLASSARELGVAANDFASTPVGMFTMGLIAWHYVGGDLVGVVFGFTWLTFSIPAWIWMYRRQFFNITVTEYETGKGPEGKRKVTKRESISSNMDGTMFFYWITLLVIITIGVVAILV